jgi:hypothetical protein
MPRGYSDDLRVRLGLAWALRVSFPPLQPPDRRAGTKVEPLGRFPPRRAGFNRFDHTHPQIIRISPRHRLALPQGPESMPKDSLISRPLRIPIQRRRKAL